MTKCNRNNINFSSLGSKKISANFNGGRITSDAGGLLLREIDKRLGLIESISTCIPDPRHPSFTRHEQKAMLAQRIYAIALGYEDLNDHHHLRNDPVMQTITERNRRGQEPLASPPTLCRLENRIDRPSLLRIAQVLVEQFIASQKQAPEELILDFDATDDAVHGNQQQRFFHGYYDHYCFLPLYVYCGGQLLVAYLRPSKIDAAKHSAAILKLLVRRFRKVWPRVRIIFRGDSSFCRWRLLRWCDRQNVYYIVGLARNSVLIRCGRPWIRRARERFRQTNRKQRIFGEFEYAAGSWDKKRRVIIKAEQLPQGPNCRFIVTNLGGKPQSLYDDVYCQRGDMENRIKEQQLHLFADRTSCHDFLANQFRIFLSAAAYTLVEHLRSEQLKGTELAKAEVNTIRLRLFKVGARVVWSVRRIVFYLSSGYPLKELFIRIVTRLLSRLNPSFAFR
jgi:hypothetical protein